MQSLWTVIVLVELWLCEAGVDRYLPVWQECISPELGSVG